MNYTMKDNDIILVHGQHATKQYIGRIKDLPEQEKPRERLIEHGPTVLSAQELLAIVLGVGTKKEEVLTMASRIFKEYGDKNVIHQTDPRILASELDLPIGKACQIVACFALGRRFFRKTNGVFYVRSAEDAYTYLAEMRSLPKEHFRGLYLNSRYQLIHDEIISIGTLTSNVVHPREVFRPALQYNAAVIIIAHNHPSGDTTPTKADLAVTKQLIEAGKIVGIDILDHIIIGKENFTSIEANYNV